MWRSTLRPAIRAGLAELAGLRDLPQLSAVFDLTRQGAGVHVSGQVSARVGQTCVVTLEPIENAVDEAVDLKFAPASGTEAEPKSARKRPRRRRRAAGTAVSAAASTWARWRPSS